SRERRRYFQARSQVFTAQSILESREHEVVHRLAVAEAHLHLRWMHVHVELVSRHVEEEECYGIAPRHDETAVRLLQRVAEAAVTNPTAVDEYVLELGIAALARRIADTTAEHHFCLLRFYGIHGFAHVPSEEQADAIQQFRGGRDFVNQL